MRKEKNLKQPRRKRKGEGGTDNLVTPEQAAFEEREQKIDQINQKMNGPIILFAYVFACLVIGLIAYILHFMIAEKDEVVANAANSRLDSYAEDVNRGDIKTSDGKIVATNNGEDRYYPYGDLFAHAVGYSKYTKAGVELIGNYYLTDSHSNIFKRLVRTLREEKNDGDTVVTTLNYELQKTAYDALGSADGAVLVMEPDTGRILAMVSKPDFDPNDIDAVWEEANAEDSTSSVLLNRATQGLYPPGSTFKVLTTLSFMRQNKDYADYTFQCEQSSAIYNGVSVHCYDYKTHGTQDLSEALANSCNQAFAEIGTQLDVGEWKDTLEDFLFNQTLPYTDQSATSQFLLDEDSDKGYIPQTAFGQGDTLITPLHNAMIISTIANGGLMMKPYMIDSVENADGKRVKKISPSAYDTLMNADEVEVLASYLRKVVTDGTAADYFSGAAYQAVGKTGTAEYANGEHDFSWFIGYADMDEPEVAVSIVVEESDVNGVKATAIARKMMDAYYEYAD